MINSKRTKNFRKGLYRWHEEIDRNMPWKATKDPYHIWISEVVLQQTRVEQGRQYYERLIKRFPNVASLAKASEDEVLRMWKGLGYYTRARNLHKAARVIVEQHGGRFPKTYEDIIALPGIGPYAAAAIASFAYDLPYAVLDGNVYRVLSRYQSIDTPIDTTEGKKTFAALSQMILDTDDAAKFNQAIMDFGALMCKPKVPVCKNCLLQHSCQGYQDGLVDLLPVKVKKVTVKKRFFHYLVITSRKGMVLEKRMGKDIWKGLYQLPMIEGERQLKNKEVLEEVKERYGSEARIKKTHEASQKLTHRLIHGRFYEVSGINHDLTENFTKATQFSKLGFPKIIDDYIKDHLHHLD